MKIIKICIVCVLSYFSFACATLDGPPDPEDPWESYNRGMYAFNDSLDRNLVKPIAQVYKDYVPAPISKGISNIFSNIGDVLILLNDILQLKFEQAAHDLARIFFNTTVGVFGIFDVATLLDFPKHNEDFGQTLGYWGVPAGTYVVLPFFGPRTIRDSFGLSVDLYYSPNTYLFDDVRTRNSLFTMDTIDYRANLLFASSLLKEAALDEYSFVKEAYLQRRLFYVYDGDPPDEDDDDEEEE